MTPAKKPDLLRDNELIYGRLLTVDEPHLIQRYNKALASFGLEPTKLKSFEIDRTGVSQQVAEECDDAFNRIFHAMEACKCRVGTNRTIQKNTAKAGVLGRVDHFRLTDRS